MLFRFYVLLTVVGSLLPYYLLINFGYEHKWSISPLLQAVTANSAVLAFNIDLVVSSIAFITFVLQDKSISVKKRYLLALSNLTIGLSCALPLYLAIKEKKRYRHSLEVGSTVTEKA